MHLLSEFYVGITIPAAKSFSEGLNTINRQNLVEFIPGKENLVTLEGDRFFRVMDLCKYSLRQDKTRSSTT